MPIIIIFANQRLTIWLILSSFFLFFSCGEDDYEEQEEWCYETNAEYSNDSILNSKIAGEWVVDFIGTEDGKPYMDWELGFCVQELIVGADNHIYGTYKWGKSSIYTRDEGFYFCEDGLVQFSFDSLYKVDGPNAIVRFGKNKYSCFTPITVEFSDSGHCAGFVWMDHCYKISKKYFLPEEFYKDKLFCFQIKGICDETENGKSRLNLSIEYEGKLFIEKIDVYYGLFEDIRERNQDIIVLNGSKNTFLPDNEDTVKESFELQINNLVKTKNYFLKFNIKSMGQVESYETTIYTRPGDTIEIDLLNN